MGFNHGFKALAYPAAEHSDPASPCSCSLVFRCDASARQATVLLEFRLSGKSDSQVFVLQYDADSLLAGSVSLSSSNTSLPRPRLDELLRDKANKHVDIKTLAFSVEQPCPLWWSDTESLGPKPDAQLIHPFVELAKATTIHVVFDYKHLRKEHHGMFKAFSKAARGLRGYPCEGFLAEHGLKKAGFEVFSRPLDIAGVPPAYDDVRERPRLASPNSPKSSQLEHPKPQSPAGSLTSEKTIPFSPSAVEALERVLRHASPDFDFQTDAIGAAVRKHIPAYLDNVKAEAIAAAIDKQLPSHLERSLGSEIINAAISSHLDRTLPTLLPTIIEQLLAATPTPTTPTPTPTLRSPATSMTSPDSSLASVYSFTSVDSLGNRYPKLPPLTPLADILIPHLQTHLAAQLHLHQARQLQRFKRYVTKTLAGLERDAYDARAKEMGEFIDDMEDQQAGFSLLKEDVLKDLEREADVVLEKRTEQGQRLSDALSEQLWDVYAEMTEMVKRAGLQRLVACEVRKCLRRRKRKRIPAGVGKRISTGGKQLLGRRKEAEHVEWVDC